MKIIKRISAILLALILMNLATENTYAAEVMKQEERYIVINNEVIIPYGENYENPETGEYFRWEASENARGTIAKNFSFKVRYSVTSSAFTVDSTKVEVNSTAYVVYQYGDSETTYVPGYEKHAYRVEILGLGGDSVTFAIGGVESGLITGLNSGGSYKVRIANEDYLEPYYYLMGTGSIRNY